MKITEHQENSLDGKQIKTKDYPFGEICPMCNRPHVFTYSDGTKYCDKCDELVKKGSLTMNFIDRIISKVITTFKTVKILRK